MKAIVLLFLFVSASCIAGVGKSVRKYYFKLDTISTEVPKGMCLIVGKVTTGGAPLADGVVSTYKHKHSATTDQQGNYELLIPSQQVMLYFFKPHYGEIVTHNYDFKSGHKVELDFFAYEDFDMLEVDKPVIYLYPQKEIDVTVKLQQKGELTFTYPQYKDEWKLTVDSSGKMVEKGDSRTYPYLFWEGKQKGLYFQDNKGEIYGDKVSRDNVVSYLENKLHALGLNENESADFITFWGPRMVKYENMLVQFVVDDQYGEIISEMEISPKPDAMRRVYMLFSELKNADNYRVAKPIEIHEFVRKGFTAIEWGGSEVKLSPQIVENR